MSDDASEHALPYVTVPVEGRDIKLGKLSVTDRAKILRDAKAAALADRKATLKEVAMAPEQAYIEIENFNSLIWGANRWTMVVHSEEGQQAILRTAVAKTNPPDQVDDLLGKLLLGPDETLKLICSLTGLVYREAAPKVPNMKQVGTYEGKPLYAPEDEATANPPKAPTAPTPAARPKAYGE